MRGPQKARVSLGLKYHHVDVFSSKPLSGNGVTVFQARKALPTVVMQELTREMRQFESIFVLQKARSQTVRAWVFTMEEELDFAGHPILGAAAALHEETMAGVRKVPGLSTQQKELSCPDDPARLSLPGSDGPGRV